MNNRKGITLIMLVIYMTIVIVLAGIIISNFLGNESMKETANAVFKSRISDYIEEFNTNMNYYKINNIDTSKYILDNYIPSISVADKEFLLINDGQLKFRNINQDDNRYQILIDLGLTKFIE